jgi:hypothetical protein
MVFVAEAFAAWLVEQVADAGRKRLGAWLLGSDQQRALQQAATAAIQATAQQLRPGPATADDAQGAEHLARVIDQVFQEAPTPAESLADHATLLQGLQSGVTARLAVLADAHITGTGRSSAALLGVSVVALAELLTGRLLHEIVVRGAGGGPLTSLAAQLNHDVTHLQGQQHGTSLARLAKDMQAALATLDRLDQQARSILARTTPHISALPTYVARADDQQMQAIAKQVGQTGIRLDLAEARRRLEVAVEWAQDPAVALPAEWCERTMEVGRASSRTFVAVLGTALLAKATDLRADTLTLKENTGERAYSARGLCHQVLVPAAVDFGFHLGATGREPLNNQPFFRYNRVDEIERVPATARPALDHLVECLRLADRLDREEALQALAAFLRMRMHVAAQAR